MIKKVLKVVGIVFVILIIGLYFTYDYLLEKELKYRLSEIINKDPDGMYNYSFSRLNINLLNGSVDLTGIVVSPTDGAMDSLSSKSSGQRFILKLTMDEIAMNGFEITEFIATGNIIVESLVITKPHFEYFFNPTKNQTEQAMPLRNIFSENFKGAELGQFSIKNAEIKVVNQTNTGPTARIYNLNMVLNKAKMDTTTFNSFIPFEYESLHINAAGMSIDASKLFSIKSDSIFAIPNKKSFGLTNFQINPKYTKENFRKLFNEQKQWFAIKLDTLLVSKINMDLFINTGQVEIQKIDLIKPNIALYKDKSKPPPSFKKKLLPASAIKSIPWILDIDTVSITNGYVSINETSPTTGTDSNLTFEELSGLLLNFNNKVDANNPSSIMSLRASTLAMGKAKTSIALKFDLNSNVDQFSVSGNVGEVEAVAFNPVLVPMMGVKVIRGAFKSINFSFTSNDSFSKGTLDADYSGLKIDVLNVDSAKSNKEKKGFMSLAANTVVKTKNSKSGGNYIQGIINNERVKDKDVWPYLWHSVQSGLISTLAPITNSKENRKKQKKVRQELRKKENDKR